MTQAQIVVKPYLEAAHVYSGIGYSPLPVNGKTLLVSEVSGRYPDATEAQIEEWRKQYPKANVALRLPDSMIALDVDAYSGDMERLKRLESELGALPKTWNADARGGKGGKLLFCVPAGTKWQAQINGIKVIQHTHRYVIVAPSVHPETQSRYEWYHGLGGKLYDRWIPEPAEIPDLPRRWLSELRSGSKPAVLAPGEPTGVPLAQVRQELRRLPDVEPCPDIRKYIRTMQKRFEGCIAAEDGLNDEGWTAIAGLFQAAYKGHRGIRRALRQLGRLYSSGYHRAGTRPRADQWYDMISRKLVEGVEFSNDDPC